MKRNSMNLGIKEIAEWLTEKVRKANENHPNENRGYVSLKFENYETNMLSYVFAALTILTQRFSSDKGDTPIAHAKLTEVSMAIGKTVSSMYEGDATLSSYQLLPIGDVFIGAFHTLGYINISREKTKTRQEIEEEVLLLHKRKPNKDEYEAAKSAPYLIKALKKFDELQELPEEINKILLKSTVNYRIPDVSKMIQRGRSVIKSYRDEHLDDLLAGITNNRQWIRSLNKMQQTGWKINEEVFDIIDREFDSMILPVKTRPHLGSPEAVKKAFDKLKEKDTKIRREKYNKEVKLWNEELVILRAASKNVETRLIYQKAKALLDVIQFYQFVELDYRGRAYYQEPFLNYQGADMARGLMLFSEGKPLGPIKGTGCKWLAIHTAVSYNESYSIDSIPEWCTYDYAADLRKEGLEDISVDKMTLEDRERWTYENMEKILDHSGSIQKDCEKPIVYLACCIEWKNYLGDVHNHISYIPVPIDGSCNGYQHSGAIAKDEITGSLVSLIDQCIQADLYLRVARALKTKRPEFFKDRPDMKMKHIRKGLVKRAVMTRAYSAGVSTMAENMYKDCHVEGYTTKFNITMVDCISLAGDIYDLISEECPGATKTMKFLQDLATFQLGEFTTYDPDGSEVSRSTKTSRHATLQKAKDDKDETAINKAAKVVHGMTTKCTRGNGSKYITWKSPSDFMVRYFAYHTKSVKVRSTIPGFQGGSVHAPGRVRHVLQEERDIPNGKKFQAGISPNFIHSMDAAHMAAVIDGWDGPFGAVHDSFSALAADVEELSKKTRSTFKDMYDVDNFYIEILEMILDGDAEIDFDTPEVGQLDVLDVLESKYFFC